jgi:hypothetical protein
VADRGRELAFVVSDRGTESTRWSYRFEASDGGTTVTESFEALRDSPWYLELVERVSKDRARDLEAGMAETLARLKAGVEAQTGGSTTGK